MRHNVTTSDKLNPGYYVFYGAMNEFQWTIVILAPSRIAKGHKWYTIGGVKEMGDVYDYKLGYLPYRLDRKNRHLLGERVEGDKIPPAVAAFINSISAHGAS